MREKRVGSKRGRNNRSACCCCACEISVCRPVARVVVVVVGCCAHRPEASDPSCLLNISAALDNRYAACCTTGSQVLIHAVVVG